MKHAAFGGRYHGVGAHLTSQAVAMEHCTEVSDNLAVKPGATWSNMEKHGATRLSNPFQSRTTVALSQ